MVSASAPPRLLLSSVVGIAFLGACAEGSEQVCGLDGRPLKVLAEGQVGATAMVADATRVYWIAGHQLRSVSTCGGQVTALADVGGASVLAANLTHLFVGGGPDPGITRVPKTGGAPLSLSKTANVRAMAVDAADVFWAEASTNLGEGSVRRLPVDGGTEEVLVDRQMQPISVALSGDDVIWGNGASGCSGGPGGMTCAGGGLWRVGRSAGPATLVHDPGTVSQVLTQGRRVFWVASSAPGIGVVDLDPPGEVRAVVQYPPAWPMVVVDGEALYFTGGSHAVSRVPASGGEPRVLVSGLPGIAAVAVNDGGVFAVDGEGRITWVAKDGSANAATAINGPCPTPVGTPEELELTPRAWRDGELLALVMEPDRATASQATYDRIVADLQAIAAEYPETRGITQVKTYDGTGISLDLTPAAARSIQAGLYGPWECLNSFYGLVDWEAWNTMDSQGATLHFPGIYNTPLLASLYAQLIGVERATATGGSMDSSRLCGGKEGTTHHYVFESRGGDCPSGCASLGATYVTTDEDGALTLVGQWRNESGEPRPAWVASMCDR